MTNKKQEDLNMILTSLVITANIMLEQLDVLAESKVYKHRLKLLTNQLIKEIEKQFGDVLTDMYNVDQGIVNDGSRSIENLINLVGSMRFDDAIVFNQLFLNYKENKEEYLKRNSLYLTKLK